jgi:anti-sigma factor RsiW
MTCRELVELVTEYLEGALPTERAVAFDQHLERCPGCETYLQQIRGTIRLTGELREDELSPEILEPLLAAFAAWPNAPEAS